jgi:hypothetical protein
MGNVSSNFSSGSAGEPSLLLAKGRRFGLVDPGDYEKLAVSRGCLYYDVHNRASVVREDSGLRIARSDFSNAELAVALLSPRFPKSLLRQRMGAAMLSAPDVDALNLIDLAADEGCASILRHIAQCGAEVEPDSPFWERLLDGTETEEIETREGMPHLTRLVEMTGMDRDGIGIKRHWVRPVESMALAP